MKTIKDLGRKVKEKHPEYSDMSDEEVGLAVKRKFPGKYDDYEDDVYQGGNGIPMPPSSIEKVNDEFNSSLQDLTGGMTDIQIDPRLDQNLQTLLDYYNPKRGVITSWWQERKSLGRTEMLTQVSSEYLEVLRQARLLEEDVRTGRVNEITFRMFVAQNAVALTAIKAQNFLIVEAQKKGLTMENDQTIKREGGLSGIRVDEAKGMSDVKVSEHNRITQIDLDRKIEEAENTVRISIINEYLSDHQKIILVQELIDTFYKQIHKIEISDIPKHLQERMIEDRNSSIEAFKKDISARQNRLFQNINGEDS